MRAGRAGRWGGEFVLLLFGALGLSNSRNSLMYE